MIGVTALLWVLAGQAVQEAGTSTSSRPEVQRLMAITGELESARDLAVATALMFTEKTSSRPDVDPRVGQIVREFIQKEFERAFAADGDLGRSMADAYARHYTAEEINALIAFYDSPVGRKVVKVAPKMAKEQMELAQKWSAHRMPALLKELQDRLRAEGLIK